MKALYIYNPHSTLERNLISRAKDEMATNIQVISVDECPLMIRNFVRVTPALIIVTDDLQGDHLLSETGDGQLLATAMLNKRMEEEDLAIHQMETHRLDNMINNEKTKVIDNYTLELIDGGVI